MPATGRAVAARSGCGRTAGGCAFLASASPAGRPAPCCPSARGFARRARSRPAAALADAPAPQDQPSPSRLAEPPVVDLVKAERPRVSLLKSDRRRRAAATVALDAARLPAPSSGVDSHLPRLWRRPVSPSACGASARSSSFPTECALPLGWRRARPPRCAGVRRRQHAAGDPRREPRPRLSRPASSRSAPTGRARSRRAGPSSAGIPTWMVQLSEHARPAGVRRRRRRADRRGRARSRRPRRLHEGARPERRQPLPHRQHAPLAAAGFPRRPRDTRRARLRRPGDRLHRPRGGRGRRHRADPRAGGRSGRDGDDEDSLRARIQATERVLYVQTIRDLCSEISSKTERGSRHE